MEPCPRYRATPLLIKIALATWKVEVVTLAKSLQNRLDIDGELQRLY